MPCVLTVDVEDWFHILDLKGAPEIDQWSLLPSRVEANFMRLLDLLDESEVKATCFFLGWIAECYPKLVLEAQQRGHEIASHGYGHRLVYAMSEAEFDADAARAKAILEDITGVPVHGYRASGFSVTEATPWFYDAVLRAGHTYDASVFPAQRGHGGMPDATLEPHGVQRDGGSITEFPVSAIELMGQRLCLFGGGYLRLFPYSLIRSAAERVLTEDRPVVFYIHPRELDPGQPRLPMSAYRRFKSYVNLAGTEIKLRRLLREFSFVTLGSLVPRYRSNSVRELR